MKAKDLLLLAQLIPSAKEALIRQAEIQEAKEIGTVATPMFCRNIVACVYPNDTGTHCDCPR